MRLVVNSPAIFFITLFAQPGGKKHRKRLDKVWKKLRKSMEEAWKKSGKRGNAFLNHVYCLSII